MKKGTFLFEKLLSSVNLKGESYKEQTFASSSRCYEAYVEQYYSVTRPTTNHSQHYDS